MPFPHFCAGRLIWLTSLALLIIICLSQNSFNFYEILPGFYQNLLSPLEAAVTIFTDGSSNGKAGYAGTKDKVISTPYNSAQKAELFAVISALQDFDQSLNIVSDSAYVSMPLRQ